MYALLVLIGVFGVPISLILLVIAAIRKRPKKKFGIAILICFIALIVGVILAPPVESSSQRESTSSTSQQDTSSAETTKKEETNTENTSAKADSIARKARDTANSATDEDISTAYEYIKANYTNCFKDSTTMEQMMYYGWLLEYKYEGDTEKQDYYTLGQNAEQLAKYVYRGSDTADSDSTKANIEQVGKSIDTIEQAKAAAEKAAAEKAAAEKAAAEKAAAEKAAAEKAAAEKAAAEKAAAEKAAAEKAAAEQSEASNSTDTASTKENSRTVYVTKTGKKYHYANPCGRGTYYPCTLAEAQARGLEPCGKCVLR